MVFELFFLLYYFEAGVFKKKRALGVAARGVAVGAQRTAGVLGKAH